MLTKYVATPPPLVNQRLWTNNEFRKIETCLSNVALLLAILGDKPIEVGAVDSGGVGFRILRIPN